MEDLLVGENSSLWYPVPGMYGGFRLEFEDENLVVLSWLRVCGGSEMRQVIHTDGSVVDGHAKRGEHGNRVPGHLWRKIRTFFRNQRFLDYLSKVGF